MSVAYLDCFSGISGDMFVGALLDAGVSLDALRQGLGTLPLEGYALEIRREARQGVQGCRFMVRVEGGQHFHRGFRDIQGILDRSGLPLVVREQAITVFRALAQAEGEIHGCSPEEVHFHEVGAVDSILDIVGAVYGLHLLNVEALWTSPLPMGSGLVKTAHGVLPVPAPATLKLLEGVPIIPSDLPYELVTPTGAALVKALSVSFGPMPPMLLRKAGYGVGSRELPDRPNLARILIGEESETKETQTVVVLETAVDDSSGEMLGYLMERLMELGALDVAFFPVQMKKGRPGVHIQVLGRPRDRESLMEVLFNESSTLGIRYRYSLRRVLPRSPEEVISPWGPMRVTRVRGWDGNPVLVPEYESFRILARRHGVPLRKLYAWLLAHGGTDPGEGPGTQSP